MIGDISDVFARVGNLLLILALLGATGAHWAVLQSVAWATMLTNNARTECLATAISTTFDGRHPCPLCRQITAGKQSERKADLQTQIKRLEFAHSQVTLVIQPPVQFRLLTEGLFTACSVTWSPPVPPPRSQTA